MAHISIVGPWDYSRLVHRLLLDYVLQPLNVRDCHYEEKKIRATIAKVLQKSLELQQNGGVL